MIWAHARNLPWMKHFGGERIVQILARSFATLSEPDCLPWTPTVLCWILSGVSRSWTITRSWYHYPDNDDRCLALESKIRKKICKGSAWTRHVFSLIFFLLNRAMNFVKKSSYSIKSPPREQAKSYTQWPFNVTKHEQINDNLSSLFYLLIQQIYYRYFPGNVQFI